MTLYMYMYILLKKYTVEPLNGGHLGLRTIINSVVFIVVNLKPIETINLGPRAASFVERSIILICPYLRVSTIGGSTVYSKTPSLTDPIMCTPSILSVLASLSTFTRPSVSAERKN